MVMVGVPELFCASNERDALSLKVLAGDGDRTRQVDELHAILAHHGAIAMDLDVGQREAVDREAVDAVGVAVVGADSRRARRS